MLALIVECLCFKKDRKERNIYIIKDIDWKCPVTKIFCDILCVLKVSLFISKVSNFLENVTFQQKIHQHHHIGLVA